MFQEREHHWSTTMAYQRRPGRHEDDESSMLTEIIPIGCLISSAAASPIMFELQNTAIWMLNIAIFFVASACFMLQHKEEIKQYGPIGIAVYTVVGLAAYSSARTSLKELVSWIPISIGITLILCVFFPPRLREFRVRARNFDFRLEEERVLEPLRYPMQPGSVLSNGDLETREQTEQTRLWLHNRDHDLAFTIGRPASFYSDQNGSTDILGGFENQPHRTEPTVRQGHPQTNYDPEACWGSFHPYQDATRVELSQYPRSLSPESMSEPLEERTVL
ncbi:hypothetical protein BJ878DRAFT_253182 [Calycina marina]|uniref:Uncharacterized protein n=1 Tax=Calycina marina TaxID=1763456 RepID=A0A9P7Z7Q2_9HELO|nr:hypothetical protein BJ878DRAFT_253182 [Calycina marina]